MTYERAGESYVSSIFWSRMKAEGSRGRRFRWFISPYNLISFNFHFYTTTKSIADLRRLWLGRTKGCERKGAQWVILFRAERIMLCFNSTEDESQDCENAGRCFAQNGKDEKSNLIWERTNQTTLNLPGADFAKIVINNVSHPAKAHTTCRNVG